MMTDTKTPHISNITPLTPPNALINRLPLDAESSQQVEQAREAIQAILNGQDDRLVVVVGPCSIHDPEAAVTYAKQLKALHDQYRETLCIIMRVYFEKPRTTIGWKGLINDPDLNGSFHINQGLAIARELLLTINQLGLPTGTEFLDTIIPQYLADLVSWAAIGARTTESQIHREMASGLSMPVGFKNGTEGNVDIAVDAVFAANHPHHFLGVTLEGEAAIVTTTGNLGTHVILRGGKQTGPNYHEKTVLAVTEKLQSKHRLNKIMVDCSHGNSLKDHRRQALVLEDIIQQVQKGNSPIFGVMIESNLLEGNQPLSDPETLEYGKSITDACIGWEDTKSALAKLNDAVLTARRNR